MKQTTCDQLTANGTWINRSGGTMYQFEIVLGDGSAGEVNSVSEKPPYAVGDTVYYEENGASPQGTPKFKVSKNPPAHTFAYNGPASKGDTVGTQWAINCARETLVSRGEDVTVESLEVWAKELIQLRDLIVANTK